LYIYIYIYINLFCRDAPVVGRTAFYWGCPTLNIILQWLKIPVVFLSPSRHVEILLQCRQWLLNSACVYIVFMVILSFCSVHTLI